MVGSKPNKLGGSTWVHTTTSHRSIFELVSYTLPQETKIERWWIKMQRLRATSIGPSFLPTPSCRDLRSLTSSPTHRVGFSTRERHPTPLPLTLVLPIQCMCTSPAFESGNPQSRRHHKGRALSFVSLCTRSDHSLRLFGSLIPPPGTVWSRWVLWISDADGLYQMHAWLLVWCTWKKVKQEEMGMGPPHHHATRGAVVQSLFRLV